MKWGDVQLVTDLNGAEYLEYSERQTKTRTGAEPRNIRAVKPKAYSFANGSPDRNPVFVYKAYSEKRPSSMTDSDSPGFILVLIVLRILQKNHGSRPVLWESTS